MDKTPKRTFIHIGYPKCASTYLQQEVFPAMGNFVDLTKQPHATRWMLMSDADPAEFRKKMEEVMPRDKPDKDHEIISYEGFAPNIFHTFTDLSWDIQRTETSQYRNPKQPIVDKIAEAYPNAFIIIIIREQIAWTLSYYKMFWRRGHTKQHIDKFIDRNEDSYDRVIEQYQKAFGSDKVLVVPFELLGEEPEAFVRSITEFIDPSHQPKISHKRVNHAPTLKKDVYYQRNKRVLKMKFKAMEKNSGRLKITAMKLIWQVTNLLALPYYALKYGGQKYQVCISDSVLKAITPEIARSNRRLEQLTGLDLRHFGYQLEESK